MRVAVVGAGIAGTVLAWRLGGHEGTTVELFTGGHAGGHPGGDATGASGGLVRAYETDPTACRLATESLVELLASPELREWSGYREVGSVYLTDGSVDPTAALAGIAELLPGSAAAADRRDLADRCPLRGLPADVVGVVERRAGYLSPARLRTTLLHRIRAAGTVVSAVDVAAVTATPGIRLADGTERRFDTVVVAAGAWSAGLLTGPDAEPVGLRTKRIQYSLYPHCPTGLGTFVDETTGLYGRRTGDGSLLIGLPSDEWDVDPAAVHPDRFLERRVAVAAAGRLGVACRGRPIRTVASFDCYASAPGLTLRRTTVGPAVFSFTGGSGGAAKTVLAASRRAVQDLTQHLDRRDPPR